MLIAPTFGRRAIPYKDHEKRKEYHRRYNKRWYKENKETVRQRTEAAKAKVRDWIKQLKGTLACEICGEKADECLEFHHRAPKDKLFSIGKATALGYSLPNVKREIQKCAVVCANCHRKIHSGRMGRIMGDVGFERED